MVVIPESVGKMAFDFSVQEENELVTFVYWTLWLCMYCAQVCTLVLLSR